jgi:hypothetical protein
MNCLTDAVALTDTFHRCCAHAEAQFIPAFTPARGKKGRVTTHFAKSQNADYESLRKSCCKR